MRRWRVAVVALAARPDLWPTVLRQVFVLAPDRWWRRRPFLPIPDRDWMAFRMTTAYGDSSAPIVADDLVVWLEWARRHQRPRRAHRQMSAPRPPGRR